MAPLTQASAIAVAVRLLALASLALAGPSRCAWAEGAPSREYEVKAAFVLNFARFVDWPEAAFPDSDAAITIGILGRDPFGRVMEETVRGETIRGRRLVVRRAPRPDQLQGCHLVFVPHSERERTEEILATFGDAPVLIVGESASFAGRGGVINLYLDGGKVRFEINRAAAQKRNLRLDAQLLDLARIVDSEARPETP